ncbi:hypothetical protein KC926_03825 [Candidatus Kaiserbacteria bacterium]|nr:hypothetical protein [Candidatus Kaiserbacteria bacterium]
MEESNTQVEVVPKESTLHKVGLYVLGFILAAIIIWGSAEIRNSASYQNFWTSEAEVQEEVVSSEEVINKQFEILAAEEAGTGTSSVSNDAFKQMEMIASDEASAEAEKPTREEVDNQLKALLENR